MSNFIADKIFDKAPDQPWVCRDRLMQAFEGAPELQHDYLGWQLGGDFDSDFDRNFTILWDTEDKTVSFEFTLLQE